MRMITLIIILMVGVLFIPTSFAVIGNKGASNTSVINILNSTVNNATLWSMFANITNIMNNDTIEDVSLASNDSYTFVWNSSDWVGALSTSIGVQQIEVTAVQDESTSHWTKSGSDLYYTAGNVGIGLIAPSSNLDVSGAIELNGVVINDWSEVNFSTNAGNSNDTLILMFANVSYMTNDTFAPFEYMTNDTFAYANNLSNIDTNTYNTTQEMIDGVNTTALLINWSGVGDSDTDNWNSNESISQFINDSVLPPYNNSLLSLFANITNIPNNDTILDVANASGLIINQTQFFTDTTIPAQANETIGHYINGTRYNQTILYEYFANITNIMNNVTILNVANASGYIFDWNESGLIINQTQFFTDTTIPAQANETIGHYINGTRYNQTILYEYFANVTQIMDNLTINNIVSSNITAGDGIVIAGSEITATSTNGSNANITYVNYLGSDLTGDSGNDRRNLTVSDVKTILVDNSYLHPSDDYNISGTTVTFYNEIWDDQNIIVWTLANTNLNMTYTNYFGSDCTGSSGGTLRNLTSDNVEQVVLDNNLLLPSYDYSIKDTYIEFKNELWDDQKITVWRLE